MHDREKMCSLCEEDIQDIGASTLALRHCIEVNGDICPIITKSHNHSYPEENDEE